MSKPSKPSQLHRHRGNQQNATEDDQHEDELPDEAHPLVPRDAGHAEGGHQDATGGGDHVGEAVAKLEGHHRGLTRDANQVAERRHDGHSDGSLGRAAGDDDINQGLDAVHDFGGGNLAHVAHRLGQALKDGVDDAAVLQDDDDAARQAHDDRRREDIAHTFEKEPRDVARTLVDGQAAGDAEHQKQGSNLHDIPLVAQHAHHEEIDRGEEQSQDEIMHRLAQGDDAQQGKNRRADGQQGQSGFAVADFQGGLWVKH